MCRMLYRCWHYPLPFALARVATNYSETDQLTRDFHVNITEQTCIVEVWISFDCLSSLPKTTTSEDMKSVDWEWARK